MSYMITLGLTALLPRSAAAQAATPWAPVREAYLEAVSEQSAITRGIALIRAIRAAGGATGAPGDVILTAYEGGLTTLRAKHGTWPPARLAHLREGLALLDRAVAARPEHAEIRYLRLMSCYYLPGILGRGRSVREDFSALARLLPDARGELPADLYQSMVRFVLEHGSPDADQRRALQSALERGDA